MERKGLIFGALVAGAALVVGGALAQQQTTIAIATGGTGGVYSPLGGGMANVLTKYVPVTPPPPASLAARSTIFSTIGFQQSEIAMVMVDAALDALKGDDQTSRALRWTFAP